jgi:ubiquinone biosynthesis UbiH/UbiF/VisC/COQ6 family hydroxylase
MSKPAILVCGTGVAGLAAALGLTRAGFNTSVLGPVQPPPTTTAGVYHPRVYAISPASQAFLSELGVWNILDEQRVTVVESMEVHGDSDGALTLHAWQAARPALAWIVESGELERALQQAVRVFGIHWHAEKFQSMTPGQVITDTGRRLAADLVVGADGAQSPVRRAAGIHHDSTPYGDTGVVTHLTAEFLHQNVAAQWFTGDTVLALLPMPDTPDGNQMSMVWSMPEAMAADLMAMPEAQRNTALELRLAAASGRRFGLLQVRSAVLGFPLFLEKSGMVAPGVALVGDAAHRVHPLAGQGLNLGLADVEELIRVLLAKEPYRRIDELRVLHRYRRARAEPIMAMRLATDGLHRLFAAQAAPIVWARNAGMHCVDRAPFIKRWLIQGASGP